MTKRWAITLWPTLAAAQQAGMGTLELEEFVERALFLDRDDPYSPRGASCGDFQAGLIERLAPGSGDSHRGSGHRPAPPTSRDGPGPTRDGKRNMPSGGGLHRAARDVRPRA